MKFPLKYIALSLVIFWMIVIFVFSSQNATQSKELSSSVTIKVLDVIPSTKDIPQEKKEEIASNVSFSVRKTAHFLLYIVLGILTSLYINCFDLKYLNKIIITLLICLIYAISDEFHQQFASGRSCELQDVLIDFSGIMLGTLIFFISTLPKIKFIFIRLTKLRLPKRINKY